jgi:hypothetical protein
MRLSRQSEKTAAEEAQIFWLPLHFQPARFCHVLLKFE